MLDVVIKNGKVVLPEITVEMDVAIKGDKIALLGKADTMPEAVKVIEAEGKYVLPGGIDTHTHFQSASMGFKSNSDWFDGTKAAAIGGTTTCIDFAMQSEGVLPMEAIEAKHGLAKIAAVDYSFHAVITQGTPEALAQIEEIIDSGIPSFKCFMIYRKEKRMADDGTVLAVMEEVKKHNGLFGAHTENADITEYNVAKALREGHRKAIYHAITKPPLVEAECVHRALFLAQAANTGFYDFHLSCKEGVEMIRAARRQDRPVYAETVTHYLTLTKDCLERENGLRWICSPPLRSQEHLDALWDGIRDGTVQTVGSDHVGIDTVQKLVNGGSFESVPNGIPGVEFRMPVVFSEGVSKGRITLNEFAAVTSTNAAKILGLYPRKGTIAVGSDADIVIFDPDIEKTIEDADTHTNLDWTPFAGLHVKGWPVLTILRGKVIAENNVFTGDKGWGQFLKRELSRTINSKKLL